jgi:rhomboid protease GluP
MNDLVDTVPPVEPPRRVVQLRLPLARPWLSWALLVLIVLIFLAQQASNALLGGDILLALGAKDNQLILAEQWWRLITPMFLHIGWVHIAFNGYALYVLGPEVETWYGTARFALIYFLAGISGNVLSFALSPNPSAGASTALFGLIATELIFFYRNRDKFGAFGQARLMNIIVLIVINFAMGFSGGIDNFGHLGGFLGGAALAWLLCPRYQVEPFGPDGLPYVVDRNSLQRAWRGVILVTLAIAALAFVAFRVQGG